MVSKKKATKKVAEPKTEEVKTPEVEEVTETKEEKGTVI
jgi:hypothetical protein